MWVRAMFKYYHVAKTVEPKRAKLQQAEAELLATTDNLNKTKARLREVEDKIERLAADFALAVEKKVILSTYKVVLQLSSFQTILARRRLCAWHTHTTQQWLH